MIIDIYIFNKEVVNSIPYLICCPKKYKKLNPTKLKVKIKTKMWVRHELPLLHYFIIKIVPIKSKLDHSKLGWGAICLEKSVDQRIPSQ